MNYTWNNSLSSPLFHCLHTVLASFRVISVDDLVTGETVVDSLWFWCRSVSIEVCERKTPDNQGEHEDFNLNRAG